MLSYAPSGPMFPLALDGPLILAVLGAAFAVVGVSHVRLYWRGREHVWFGLASLAAAALTAAAAQTASWPRYLPHALAPLVLAGTQVLAKRVRRHHRELVE